MKNESGVSLIIVFFIAVTILSVVISLSTLLYGQIKVVRNISNSTLAYYAAESGVEKVLFYDRQIRAIRTETSCATDQDCIDVLGQGNICDIDVCAELLPRGLCYMETSCANDETPLADGDRSIYCNNFVVAGSACEQDICSNCELTFDTKFTNVSYPNYKIEAGTDSGLYFYVQTIGEYNGVTRKVEATQVNAQ